MLDEAAGDPVSRRFVFPDRAPGPALPYTYTSRKSLHSNDLC